MGEAQRKQVPKRPTDVAPHEIERALKRGALWALGSQVAVQAIRFAGVVALARLLTPSDYGAAALAITIGTYSMILGDLGYGTALVQAPNASQRRASTAFWCSLGAGMIGLGIVVLGAYPAARLLGEPEVTGLVIAGGLTLLLVAAGSTSNALLTRSMSFGVIQGAGMIAALIATACAVAAAVLGAGAWALVLQQVILAAVTSACFILPARWHPSLEFSRSAMRSLTRFAVPYTAGSAFIVLQGLVTVLLVGSLLGIEELGIWNLSMALVVVPMTLLAAPISRVVYAAFARMRDDQERVTEVWLNGFTMLAAVLLPVLFCLIAVAPDLVPLAFGRQWVAAVPVVQTLCVLIMSRALQQWNVAVLDAAGRPQVNMLLSGAVLIALPPSILLGSAFGMEGVAITYALAALIFGELPSFLITTRHLSLKPLSVLGCIRGIAFSAAAACIAVVFARQALEQGGISSEPRLALSIVVGAVAYLSLLALVAPGVSRQLLGIVRGLRHAPGAGADFEPERDPRPA